jgi:hypothetical protein
MTYTGAQTARTARERLGQALASLQQHSDIPNDVMAVASNIAQSVGALFEAERASSELDGRASVKNALGTLGQTLALLQDVPEVYKARLEVAVEAIATSMSALYPLAHVPSMPPAAAQAAHAAYAATAVGHVPPNAPVPNFGGAYAQPAAQPAGRPSAGAAAADGLRAPRSASSRGPAGACSSAGARCAACPAHVAHVRAAPRAHAHRWPRVGRGQHRRHHREQLLRGLLR